ncbi:SusC/RagA family TonB-linked outer membrane protein [Sphingobacterium alkalisoli]|uniref:SusC/RagA family TonB-linked outer membrane protein n=1 Tax=Sphingobacterium alkalisoli TaxID=1874115 RepID=A0A4U0GYS1_9SPHI|nr:SusC/RagA family TonB-linked outer membrane protein [Sphingobacterium alkalisoli]TJY64370.1 SusC/RagA family TonB-linked outer membrane protein [Sphingobacterium alkalisoli]GGH22159.1 SusC/RagA family TonB-linked outer membrane protein [Sphingobacterium alkalisoli]
MKHKNTLNFKTSFLAFALLGTLCIPKATMAQVPATQVQSIPKVIGRVVGSDHKPLSGVTVSIKEDKQNITTTNRVGEFILSPQKQDETLAISAIGYKTQEIKLSKDTKLPLIIKLEETTDQIEEVVVTGYGNRSKESFTGSSSTFTKEELLRVGNKNVLQSLQNLDPSFVLMENLSMGSNPNMLPDIQLRGQTGLDDIRGEYSGNPNEPLFILDGFEANLQKIFDLDMNRIASVTILRDAAAKAIYGAKAANGVLIIETIVPPQGSMRVSYNANFNLEAPDLTSYSLANAREKLQIEKNAGRYTSAQPVTQQFHNEQYNAILANIEKGVDTYWLSQPLRVGLGNKHTLMLEGGTQELRYGLDFTYNNVTGVMKGSNRENMGGSINLSYRSGKFNFRNILNVTFNKSNNSPYGSFSEYTALNPYYSPYDEYGNIAKLLGTYATGTGTNSNTTNYFNPLYNAQLNTKNFSRYNEITENFYAEWQTTRELRLTARLGFTFNGDNTENFLPGDHTSFALMTGENFFNRGSYYIGDGRSTSLSSDLFANYSKQFGKHQILLNGGLNIAAFQNQSHGMSAQGFLSNRADFITFAKQYAANGVPSGSESLKREIGIVSFGNYSYDNKYLADLSYRTNASSVFGADNRWGNFWSLGLGWNIHHEEFLKNNKIINQWKLRGSVGSTGSQNFNPYQAMATYSFFSQSTYDNISGAYLQALANENLKWQEKLDYNLGTDLKLFNRLNARFDYYISHTNNLLTDLTLPPSTGFFSFKENLGQVQNIGYEGSLNYMLYSNPQKQSYFSIFTAFSSNKNKLLKISDALKQTNKDQDAEGLDTDNPIFLPKIRYEEGQSTSAIWAVPSRGIDPSTGREVFVKKDGSQTYTWSADDQIAVGVTDPKLRGNFGFNMEYKGWGLSTSFRYTIGEDYYNSTLITRVENVNIAHNVDTRVLYDTWLEPGNQAFFKRITTSPTKTNPTSRFLQKKSDLTLASVNAYYDFKWKNISKYYLKNLKVGVFVSEAFVLSTVRNERGTDYPFARTFSFTLQTAF